MTVVYRATPGQPACDTIVFLRSHGIDPFAMDPLNPDAVMSYAAKGTLTVRIAVSPEEAERAARLLAQRDAQHDVNVKRHVTEARRLFLSAGGLALLAGTAAAFALSRRAEVVLYVLPLTTGCFALPALVGLGLLVRFVRPRVKGPPRCDECAYLLRGLPEPRCPECGTPFDERLLRIADLSELQEPEPPVSTNWRRRLAGWLGLVLVQDWGFVSAPPGVVHDATSPSDAPTPVAQPAKPSSPAPERGAGPS